MENKKLDIEEVMQYDTVILGGGIYAGTVNGLDFLLKNWEKLRRKHIFIFAVGSGEGETARVEQFWNRQMTAEQRAETKVFYMRGGFDFSKLNRRSKIMMRFFRFMLKRQKNPTDEIKELLKAYETPVDYTAETNILPLIASVRKIRY